MSRDLLRARAPSLLVLAASAALTVAPRTGEAQGAAGRGARPHRPAEARHRAGEGAADSAAGAAIDAVGSRR